MADIKINDLKPAGADLFADDEGLMQNLDDSLSGNVFGGLKSNNEICFTSARSCIGCR
ncbi:MULTISPECIES: hypothetical protein [unclassified Moorena]|uniref:hypothetical protein n=1 Tax=unclassified Moorena TaxID=2683338 RepID=UPI0013FEB363|nr:MULTISPECIES: hypothetical protein [unclassified Moorena]NEO12819.1 hypothetical protein [Moorena sp. SIO3E8]NEQ04159.1 hypothetical protein [Moorena sp. SIO3F7]